MSDGCDEGKTEIKTNIEINEARVVSRYCVTVIFRSGGSLELTMSRQSVSQSVTLISKKSINSELHNMVQYPDIVKHSGIPNRSSKIA